MTLWMSCGVTAPSIFCMSANSLAPHSWETIDMLERLPADDATPGIGGSGIKDAPVLPHVPPARVRTREILESDIGPVTCLLASGFSRSTRNDWLHIFAGLAEHPAPAGLPKYGYL